MYRFLITVNLSPHSLEFLECADDVTYDVLIRPTRQRLLSIISRYDALIFVSSIQIDAELLAAASRLKVVGRAGVGLDNVDIDAASSKGVIVMNTPGANAIATAEHTMAMLLAICRLLPRADQALRSGEWNRFPGIQLYGKTLGVIGLGRIGTYVAQRARAFGMTVVAFDPYIDDQKAFELEATMMGLEELLASADFITLHAALTPETRHFINTKTIGQMKPGVRLVNCARGGLVDEAALVVGLRSGHIAAAALDVFENEPLPDDSALRGLENVVLTPHMAASTAEAGRAVATQLVDQILAALRGEGIRNAVNMSALDG